MVGVTLFVLAIGMGFTGYSLPDDLLSGTGLRIAYSALISIPFVGPYLGFLVFGGEFPTEGIISRLFVLHVMLLPAVIIALIGVHLGVLWRQKHTQFAGKGRTERNVVGKSFWPQQFFKSFGLMLLTGAALALLGGLVQINAVWNYGPFDASAVSAPSQPDWYVGWLEGAIRLFPAFEPTIFGVTIPSMFIPGVVIPGIGFTVLALWPFIEQRVTQDIAMHNILDNPRDRPARSAIGVGAILYVALLTIAGGNDVLALTFNVPIEAMVWFLRIGLFVIPVLGGFITYRICTELQSSGARPARRKGGTRLRRNAEGGFEEVHSDSHS
jgi:ubiquinol-cytochrome c reductase cytochrome b subunit